MVKWCSWWITVTSIIQVLRRPELSIMLTKFVEHSWLDVAGLAKILKKYDKRTGSLLRLPFIQKVLQQPFFTTELVSKLIKECEGTIERLFPTIEEIEDREHSIVPATTNGQSIFRNTVAALENMQEMRRGSSTYSHFSLPPMNVPDVDVFQSLQPTYLIPIPWLKDRDTPITLPFRWTMPQLMDMLGWVSIITLQGHAIVSMRLL